MNKQDVLDYANDLVKNGRYNKQQALSVAWAEFFEEKLAQIESKYRGNFDAGYKFDCYCFDCKKGNMFGAPSSIKLFIDNHLGHKTKTLKLRG